MGFANILDSLGWAILHSTWQGGVLALAVLMFRSLTRDSQASLRCGFQVLCLLTALLAFIGTFLYYQLGSLGAAKTTAAASLFGLGGGEISFAPAQTSILTGQEALSGPLTFQAYIPWVGTIWVVGFTLLSLKYAAALWMTHQLRYRGLSDAPLQWQSRFRTLSLNVGIRRRVELFVSDRVSGPLTLGFFKPVVLVPASFFVGLPPEQIEAILLHEIAHIRRHDYMINLLQTAIRTIFFYHPAIHYISKRIDDDRERACDDFAVALTRDPQSLARGLASLRLNLSPQSFALAANDGKSPLVSRLNRLIDKEDVGRRPEQVIASATALIVAAGLYANFSPLANAHPDSNIEPEIVLHPSGQLSNYRFEPLTKDGKTFTVKLADNGTRWASLNGNWYDVDKNDWVVAKLPAVPAAPKAPSAEKLKTATIFKDTINQYKVDLDYYIASLENTIRTGNKGVDLEEQLKRAEQQRDQLHDPEFEFEIEPVAPISPQPIEFTAPAVAPTAPVIKIASHDVSQSNHPAPGLYVDGERVATEDWSDDLQDRLDDALEDFEGQMEDLEEQFEDIMEDYEDQVADLEDNLGNANALIAKANKTLAQAVLNSNQEREILSQNLDREISDILANADVVAEQAMKIAEVQIDKALADVQKELKSTWNLSEEDRREVEEDLRDALQDLHEEKRELMEESRMERKDVLEAAREARQEAQRDRREWEREIEREAVRAQRDAIRAKNEVERAARDYEKSAEWRQKESDHVKSDYREYHAEMLEQLKDDGLINQSANSATISYVDKKMHVNGKQVPRSKEDDYCEINEEYHIYKHSNTTIRLMPNGVEIENGYFKYGDTYSTRWTYNER